MSDNTRTITPVNTEVEQFCITHTEASFCGGPSVKECPDGRYIPEDHEGCATTTTPVPSNREELENLAACQSQGGSWNSDEQVCISKEPAVQEKTPIEEEVTQEETATETKEPRPSSPVETLPETGMNDVLFGSALALVAIGTAMVRWARN